MENQPGFHSLLPIQTLCPILFHFRRLGLKEVLAFHQV